MHSGLVRRRPNHDIQRAASNKMKEYTNKCLHTGRGMEYGMDVQLTTQPKDTSEDQAAPDDESPP
jgi:hypothetical protein